MAVTTAINGANHSHLNISINPNHNHSINLRQATRTLMGEALVQVSSQTGAILDPNRPTEEAPSAKHLKKKLRLKIKYAH